MKIVILSSNISNEAGGYSESSFLLRNRLEKIKGNDVYLFGFWKSKFFKLNYKLTDRINIFSPGYVDIFPFSIKYFKKLFNIKPEIIDIQGLWSSTSILSLMYHFFSKTPYIVTPRGMLEEWALKQSYFKKKVFYFIVEKFHLKYATYLRATSDLEALTFRKLGFKENKILNIPNSIKIPNFKSKQRKKNKKKRLLFLSRLHPKKGLVELLNAWKKIQINYPDWELLICGFNENNYKKVILTIIKDLNLKRVILKDFVTGKEKEKIYYSSDVFILLSHSENFGLSIAEALSYKIPVITTTNTPWKKLNKFKCGWCIKLNAKIIVKTIEKAFLMSRKERTIMGQNGREWMIKDFSDSSIGIRMDAVYKKILEKNTP